MTVMLAMTPWNQMGSGITGSPFVGAFSAAGIPYASTIMNIVVITAALSSSNTDLLSHNAHALFLGARWLRAELAGQPQQKRGSDAGIRHFDRGHDRGDSVGDFCARQSVLDAVWSCGGRNVLRVGRDSSDAHRVSTRAGSRTRGATADAFALLPLFDLAGILAIAGIAVTTFYVDGLQYTVPAFLPFLLLVSVAYWRVRGKERRAATAGVIGANRG